MILSQLAYLKMIWIKLKKELTKRNHLQKTLVMLLLVN